ncbi:MAG: hypothetical protein JNK87_08015 [Bryobacterales bacterium]|nr:hypothetical protein [Bryobacterales bacterium]
MEVEVAAAKKKMLAIVRDLREFETGYGSTLDKCFSDLRWEAPKLQKYVPIAMLREQITRIQEGYRALNRRGAILDHVKLQIRSDCSSLSELLERIQ